MRYLIIGYGIQGKKRHKILKKKCVGILDPYKKISKFQILKKLLTPKYLIMQLFPFHTIIKKKF